MTLNPMVIIRRKAYRKTFDNPEGRKVLADLRRFCRGTVPYADINNERATYLLAGRNEVWCRILAHLHLTEEDVIQLVEEYPEG